MSRARLLKRLMVAGAITGGGGLVALWTLPSLQESRKNQVQGNLFSKMSQQYADPCLIASDQMFFSAWSGQSQQNFTLGFHVVFMS